jgi:predicted RNA-binding protein Jag
MKTYEGKVLDEVLQKACQDLGVTLEELKYEITEEKKTLFTADQTKLSYSEVIGKLPFNARAVIVDINNIKRINSIDEVGNDKYYIIDIRKVKTHFGLVMLMN